MDYARLKPPPGNFSPAPVCNNASESATLHFLFVPNTNGFAGCN